MAGKLSKLQKKDNPVGLTLISTIGFCIFAFSFVLIRIFSIFASAIKLFALSLPLTSILFFLLLNKINNDTQHFKYKKSFKVFFFISITGYAWGLLSYLNVALSHQPIQQFSIEVLDKNISHTKYGKSYFVNITLPINTSCCFIEASDEKIIIQKELYEKIIPVNTKINIDIKKGFFNIYVLDSIYLNN